jgi:hypothetical protein
MPARTLTQEEINAAVAAHKSSTTAPTTKSLIQSFSLFDKDKPAEKESNNVSVSASSSGGVGLFVPDEQIAHLKAWT